MGELWFVFGLIPLTVEWILLRRLTPRLRAGSVLRAVLVGAGVGVAISFSLAVLGVLFGFVAGRPGLDEGISTVLSGAATVMLVVGILFAPIAAVFGALLTGVEVYRAQQTSAEY